MRLSKVEAIVSGQAGIAIIRRGERLFLLDARTGTESGITPEGSRVVLGDACDAEYLRDVTFSEVFFTLHQAWRNDTSLHLVLLLLSPTADDEARKLAAQVLEGLLVNPRVTEYVENILFSSPMPPVADIDGAFMRCQVARAQRLLNLLLNAYSHRNEIGRIRQTWDALESEMFDTDEAKASVKLGLIKRGVFRRLVLSPETADRTLKSAVDLGLLPLRAAAALATTRQQLAPSTGSEVPLVPSSPASEFASLIERHNDGVRATEELAYSAAPHIKTALARRFPGVGIEWEDIEQQFVDKCKRYYLLPERAGTFQAWAAKVAVQLAIDRLRKSRKLGLAVPLEEADIEEADIEDVRATELSQPTTARFDTEAVSAYDRLRLEVIAIPYRAAENPPHQLLAWMFRRCLEIPFKTLVEKGPAQSKLRWIDLPLNELLSYFLKRIGGSSSPQWEEILRPLMARLRRPVETVLSHAAARAIPQSLRSKTCGDTCLRDYAQSQSEHGKATMPGSHSEVDDKGSKRPEELLRNKVTNWVEQVDRRMPRLIGNYLLDEDRSTGKRRLPVRGEKLVDQ